MPIIQSKPAPEDYPSYRDYANAVGPEAFHSYGDYASAVGLFPARYCQAPVPLIGTAIHKGKCLEWPEYVIEGRPMCVDHALHGADGQPRRNPRSLDEYKDFPHLRPDLRKAA